MDLHPAAAHFLGLALAVQSRHDPGSGVSLFKHISHLLEPANRPANFEQVTGATFLGGVLAPHIPKFPQFSPADVKLRDGTWRFEGSITRHPDAESLKDWTDGEVVRVMAEEGLVPAGVMLGGDHDTRAEFRTEAEAKRFVYVLNVWLLLHAFHIARTELANAHYEAGDSVVTAAYHPPG